MPVTKFEADFNSFYAAVDTATSKMASFTSKTDTVTGQLNRMVDAFSGRQLIQQATLSAEAVERLGGVSKLTQQEIARLGSTAQEAVAKMRAMGVDVPAGIEKYVEELEAAKVETAEMGGIVEEVGGKLAAMFAIERIADWIIHVGQGAEELEKLSRQTHTSIDDIQTLALATKEYGVESEELAKALYHVSKGLDGGDDSVVRGLHEAGLSLDDVRGKNGKELFLTIEDALSHLQGTMRDTAAADIFGARMGSAMAQFADKAREATDNADKFGHKLTEQDAAALSQYNRDITELGHNLSVAAQTMAGSFIEGIKETYAAIQHGVGWTKLGVAALKDYVEQMVMGHGPGMRLAMILTDQADAAGKVAGAEKDAAAASAATASANDAEAAAAQFLAKTRLDAEKELEPWQTRDLDALRDMGQLNEKNAAAIGVSSDQFKQYTENVKRAEEATKALTAATLADQTAVDKLKTTVEDLRVKQTGTPDDQARADLKKKEQDEIDSINRRRDAAKAALIANHADTKEAMDALDNEARDATTKVSGYYAQMADGIGTDFHELTTHSQAYLNQQAQDALDTWNAAIARGDIGRAELDKLREKYQQAAFAATAAGQAGADAHGKATAAVNKTFDAVAALNKELDDEKKLHEEIQRTIQFTYDLSTAAGMAQFKAMNPTAQVFADTNYFKTHNIADAVAAGLITGGGFSQFQALHGGATGFTPEPAPAPPPAAPSTAPSSTAAPGPRAAGAAPVNVNVNVSGVFDPSSSAALKKTVSDGLAKGLTTARVLSGAWG
jgi:hypothetical protein